MNVIEIIREWLERNKIFFEIIVTLSLTVMSIYVSCTANQIAAYQNTLMKEENQPIFTFYTGMYDNSTQGDVPDTIDIDNVGKPAFNFSVEPYVFYGIQQFDDENNVKKSAIIPILDFYYNSDYSSSSIGHMKLLSRLTDVIVLDQNVTTSNQNINKNESDIIELDYDSNNMYYSSFDEMNKINKDLDLYLKNKPKIYIYLYTYVRITYKDIYGDDHDEIYLITMFGNYYKLSDYDRIHLEREYNKLVLQNQSIDEIEYIPPKEIISRLSNSSLGNYILPTITNIPL